MQLLSILDIKDLENKRVLVRVDWNVPMKNGQVVDDFKITRSLATIRHLQNKGAIVIIVSHLGRPIRPTKTLSLTPVVKRAAKLLGVTLPLLPFITAADRVRAAKKIADLKRHHVVVLENIRFCKGEDDPKSPLACELAELADIFVLDGFGVAHRDAASVTGVARYLPSFAGLLLAEETRVLSEAVQSPKRPLVVILGGAKVETKIPALQFLLKKADFILLGGGLVNTYLWATGHRVGSSLVGKAFKRDILKYCTHKKIILPVDAIVGEANGKHADVVSLHEKLRLKANQGVYDIGPATVLLYSTYIKRAQTLIWNGALGKFEVPIYGYGTKAISCLFAARSKGKALGIAGGGETIELLQYLGLTSSVDLVSTGGGAMLEFLSGKKLPGITSLQS